MVPVSHTPSILTHCATQATLFGSILRIRRFGFHLERKFENKILAIYLSVQLLSRVRLLVTPWTAAHQASLSITSSQSLLRLTSIELVMPSNHLILCHPLLLLPTIPPSIRVFSSESTLPMRWPNIGVLASTSVLLVNTQD